MPPVAAITLATCCCWCSLRAQFAVEGVSINQLHGSDSEDHAEKEILYFFPIEQTVAIVKPDAYHDKGRLAARIGNESVPKIIMNDTIKLFFKLQSAFR